MEDENQYIKNKSIKLELLEAYVQFPKIAQKLSLRSIDRIIVRLILLPEPPGIPERQKWPEQIILVFASILEVVDKALFTNFIAGNA